MTHISPAPLERAIRNMLKEIRGLPKTAEDIPLERYEKLAKAISLQVKAVQDITAHNARNAAQKEETKYLRYEDLPPPHPDDQADFIKRLTHLYHRFNAARDISSDDSRDAGA